MKQVRGRRTQAERSAETRRMLLDAAVAVLYEHGYGATTTMLVADRAGVSRGAMLHQFRTKADLMTFVVQSVYEDEVAHYKEMLQDITDPRERVIAYPEAAWKMFSRPSGIAVLEILQGSRSDKVLAKQLKPLQARIEANARTRVQEELGGVGSIELMRLIVWSMRGLSVAKILAPEPSKIAASVRLLRDLLEAGFDAGLLTIRPDVTSSKSKKRTA